MIAKIAVATALLAAVWAFGVGIDRAGGERLVRAAGDREGVLTPETPIDLDAVVASRTIRHTALVSIPVPKVSGIDPGSVKVETPGYSVDNVRATPVLEFRPEKNPKPRSVLLLLDNSLSMVRPSDGQPPSDPDYHRLDACRLLLDALPETDQVSLACFPALRTVADQQKTNRPDHPYQILADAVKPMRAELQIDRLRDEENAYTPLYRAVVAGAKTLAESPAGRRRVMVLLTDGKNEDLSNGSLIEAATALKSAGVEMYAVGLGPVADIDTLRRMSPHVLRADDAQALSRSFRDILHQMSREVVEVDLDVVVGRTGTPIPPGRKVAITFRSNGRLYTTHGVTK